MLYYHALVPIRFIPVIIIISTCCLSINAELQLYPANFNATLLICGYVSKISFKIYKEYLITKIVTKCCLTGNKCIVYFWTVDWINIYCDCMMNALFGFQAGSLFTEIWVNKSWPFAFVPSHHNKHCANIALLV